MAALTIRRLDERTKTRLRIRAAHHGRSMEEEAREILNSALTSEEHRPRNLAEAIKKRFAPLGGVNLPSLSPEPIRKPPSFKA